MAFSEIQIAGLIIKALGQMVFESEKKSLLGDLTEVQEKRFIQLLMQSGVDGSKAEEIVSVGIGVYLDSLEI